MYPGGEILSSSEQSGGVTPALFSESAFLEVEGILNPDLRNPPFANYDELDRYMAENSYRALKMFRKQGYAGQLLEICNSMPGTSHALRARDMILSAVSQGWGSMDLTEEVRQFAADNALDVFRDQLGVLNEVFADDPRSGILNEAIVGSEVLLKHIHKAGLWTDQHTTDLCKLLEEDWQHKPDLGFYDPVMKPVAQRYGISEAEYDAIPNGHARVNGRLRSMQQIYIDKRMQYPNFNEVLLATYGLRTLDYTSVEHAQRMYERRDNPPRRASFMLVPYTGKDNDNVFKYSAGKYESMHETTPDDTDWVILQYASVEELAQRLDFLIEHWQMDGAAPGTVQEVPFIAFTGHGQSSYIQLEPYRDMREVKKKFTVEQLEQIIAPRLKRMATANTTILMDSCHTASPNKGSINLAEAANQATGCRVIAGEAYNVIEKISFVPSAVGDLAVRVTHAMAERDLYGNRHNVGRGTYIYPARQQSSPVVTLRTANEPGLASAA